MKTWKKVTLREVADIIPGYAFKGEDFCITGAPVIKIKDINPPSVLYDTLERVDLSRYKNKNIEKYTAAKNDFVIAMTGATIGKVGKIRFSDIVYINQRVAKIRPNEAVCWDFIYYCAISNLFYQHIINNIDSNSAQENISATSIGSFSFYLPPLPEQKAIAGVLSSLDDKIDLLQRQNATLEAMAETLFRQWFIEEAQEDWEEYPLSSFIEIIGGGTPKTSEESYWHGDILWMSGGDIASSHKSFIFDTDKKISSEGLENSSANLLPKFSTVITARGTVGKICLLGEQAAFSQTNYGILPRIAGTPFFTFLLMSDLLCYLKQSAYGSVFDTITRSTFEEIKFNCPTDNYIVNFENMISPFFQKMFSNCRQIRTLEKLRDTLLPKLMSGEVRVRVDG